MESVSFMDLVSSLSGPGAAVTVLFLVLFGIYRLSDKLIMTFLEKLSVHLQSIEEKFDKLGSSMDSLAKDVSALRVIVEKQELKLEYELDHVKDRLSKLEGSK